MNDILLLLGLIIVIGTVISFYHKAFRSYWVFALIAATLLAVLYQIVGYLEAGYLAPFYNIAFVMSWIAFFGVVSVGYVAYRFLRKRKPRQEAGRKQL